MSYIYDTNLVSLVPSNALLADRGSLQDAFQLYYALEQYHATHPPLLDGPALPALGHAISGAAGSAISTLLTYPLSLIVTRLQVQRLQRRRTAADESEEHKDNGSKEKDGETETYTGILDALHKIPAAEGGVGALYRGAAHDAAKTVIDSFLFFLAYSAMRARLTGKAAGGPRERRPTVAQELVVSMTAGAVARLVTTPAGNVVTHLQTAPGRGAAPPGAMEIARRIVRERGVAGLWAGYGATLVLTLNPALTFVFHELLLRMLVRRDRRDRPGPRITFLVAALSKAVASAMTYPFQLAKARAQVSTDANAGKRVRATPWAVFGMVARIAREEGVLALYRGLEGEVLKGFFSHGLTMLLKERIHRVVVQTYYLVLRALRRYPSAEEIAETAGQTMVVAAAEAGTKMDRRLDEAMGTMHELYQHAKESEMDIIDEYIRTDDDDW